MTKQREHGVMPGLLQRYATRITAERATFLLRYLRPGILLLDIRYGPGSITLDLAEAIAPNRAGHWQCGVPGGHRALV